MPEPIIGIDLGTTYSLVAIAHWPPGATAADAAPRILPDEQGRALCPSVVRFRAEGPPIVGHEAKAAARAHPGATIASAKRLMGRGVRDAAGDAAFLPYRLVAGPNDTARIELPMVPFRAGATGIVSGDDRTVSPQEVAAAILGHLKAQAERALGVAVAKAVVTVPAYFDDAQRQATRDAGRLAGLEVVRVVNEPTAAALAYGLGVGSGEKRTRHVVIYDFGGGTFDVSILRLTPADDASNPVAFFQVIATAGDTRLGGDDLDRALMTLIAQRRGERVEGLDPEQVASRVAEAEGIKIALSGAESVTAESAGAAVALTRTEFEGLAEPLVRRTLDSCRRAMRDADRDLGGVALDAVVMVGGSTRIPLVRRRVAEQFGMEPYTAIDPDQVVALGAAVQGSILAGATRGALLLDVLPLSLGIETVGGAVAKIVMRNSPVPAKAAEMFSTSVDNQTGIELNIYQGEREMAGDCRLLGRFKLSGLPPMPAGIPQVNVEFLVDANGVLTVRAAERRSGKRASVQVVPNHGLSRDEVERLEREAFANAREDMTRHRVVDLVANGKLDLHWIKPQLVKHGAGLAAPAREALERAVVELEDCVKRAAADWRAVDADALHRAKETLDRASIPLHELSIAASLRGPQG